ncbi:hypothetical protein MCP_0036 [Methanocella paludicola SANAE]|uniref:Uncharacterized protein n=1 Tax=Methanocella paludicola (strain DSM 17711 / JCM 13418 / NBRC 101707 / SANAE) TaxID=304371 RepID=D1YUI6_METPS|nr:hypothetical protein [Methanocella paludicola]BAI60108.1 hypothetical protein MCP_0036 [Methanocella paludicola SANAE]
MRTAILFLVIVLLIAAPLPACEAAPGNIVHAADDGYGLGCPGCPGCPDNPVRDPNAPACF